MVVRHILQWANCGRILAVLVLCTVVSHIQADDTSVEPRQLEHADDSMQHSVQKRTWKSLQGGWGKRSPTGGATSNDPSDSNADYNYGYPGRSEDPADYNSPDNELDKLNKYLIKGLINQRLNHMDTQYDGSDEDLPMDKRAWNKMNAGWGKRVNSGPAQWNKFRGAWGKREPGWNNLKGLWGKRSEKWNKLSSSWGKRDSGNSNSY